MTTCAMDCENEACHNLETRTSCQRKDWDCVSARKAGQRNVVFSSSEKLGGDTASHLGYKIVLKQSDWLL